MSGLLAFWQAITDTLRHVTVTDLIDVSLIAFIFYRIALALRGTRTVSLVRGLIVVGILLWLSIGLPTFNWILRRVLPTGVIALVIIFQPELRLTLERLGRGRWFGGGLFRVESQLVERVVSEVMDACEQFSEARVGALIVLEREANLLDITRTGKTINGLVSSELIATIFSHHSPLHDGAIVVRDDRIIAAGCALPHSENPGLSVTTGMRHRAALGLSERTDAVCVVVSEETGGMSLAFEGTLTPNLERIQMTERLLELFEAKQRTSPLFFWRK
jgi:diadenylate cyclase